MSHHDLFDSEDIPSNLSENTHFQDIVAKAQERRGFIKKGLGLSAAMFLAGPLAACGGSNDSNSPKKDHANNDKGGDQGTGKGEEPRGPLLGFDPVKFSTADSIVVPAGYTANVIAPWGTALVAGAPTWRGDGSESAADQAKQVGENHDGIHFFPLDGQQGGGSNSEEGLLVMNHEYCTTKNLSGTGRVYQYLFGADPRNTNPWSEEKAHKAMNAHGVSVIHIKRDAQGKWDIVSGSKLNRRITAQTEMELTGPVAGDVLVRTNADPSGRKVFGTINNCGNGWTPWGTYLTCEENFNTYFGTQTGGDQRTVEQKRYGIQATSTSYRWAEVVERFDYVKEPNESHRFGWIVEIDPFNPDSKPKKRTALGRIKHENAAYRLSADNRIVVYTGDDQANDYIYKFVSDGKFVQGGDNSKLLDSGKLYVAKFNNDKASEGFMGKGEWLLLDRDANPVLAADPRFVNQAAVLVYTRIAADLLGATKMDRPEWVAVHPTNGDVYVTLTNNSSRTEGDGGPNPRAQNRYGQIVSWRETDGDPTATSFEWDLFVLAGNPNVYPETDLRSGSENITKENTFNSPDGLGFDQFGRLWIQSDGAYSNTGDYEGQGNNQMLCADPNTKEIRRFLVGPKSCEVTGIAFTPDSKTMFINIQHPGEADDSQWPDMTGGMPRSATVIITKNDGGVIGS